MAKHLLQDMVRKTPKPKVKIPERIKIPEPAPEPVKITIAPKIPSPIIKPPEPKIPPRHSYSDFETKFASINDVGDDGKDDGKSRHALWVVACVSALFLVFALSFLFSSAKITVNPKVKNQVTNLDLSAIKNGGQGTLPFDVVVISGEEQKTVTAGAEKDVAIQAKGKAVIYNTFSSASQSLAIDTRLEGSNGKLYKTTTKTTVPGMKGNTPGSVEVSIYAAEAGAEYNSGPLDFKIFGFKGTPKYSKFYARSVGDLTGGFEGKSTDVSDADKERITTELETALRSKLLSKAVDQIPSGFVLFKDGAVMDTTIDGLKLVAGANNTATASLSGTLSGFLFDEKKLTAKIVEKILVNEDAGNLSIPNIRELTMTLANKDNINSNSTNISFNLSGNLKIIWKVDETKLISDILGRPKKEFSSILSGYPNIDSAQLGLRPFWKSTVPTKASDIKVIVNYPE
jgi:hypothetical protein